MDFKKQRNSNSLPTPIHLPDELQGDVRYLVVRHPEDFEAYSIGVKYICQTEGADDLIKSLLKNVTRKHKKHVNSWLCAACVTGTTCALAERCPNIHVTAEGYRSRRLWRRASQKDQVGKGIIQWSCPQEWNLTRLSSSFVNLRNMRMCAAAPMDARLAGHIMCGNQTPNRFCVSNTMVHNPYSCEGYQNFNPQVSAQATAALSSFAHISGPAHTQCKSSAWGDCNPSESMDFSIPIVPSGECNIA
eukprot:TRINITY_DN8087_c0_g1_i1.p1 TRINITY_DN8087_c0_g1~~TRINITY_DN8087_c0_g1_i1.p1  ORF type:complete len:246 (+),score=25.91 TRINITY_DN8087_c0_g1_i1:94-831(+)